MITYVIIQQTQKPGTNWHTDYIDFQPLSVAQRVFNDLKYTKPSGVISRYPEEPLFTRTFEYAWVCASGTKQRVLFAKLVRSQDETEAALLLMHIPA